MNTTRDISKLSQISRAVKNFIRLSACEITYKSYNNFEISLVVFMPNITTNHAVILPIVMAKSPSMKRSEVHKLSTRQSTFGTCSN